MTTTDRTTYRPIAAERHIERLDDETLVYDVATDGVLRLGPIATAVWDACRDVGEDGATATALASSTGLATDRVDQALAALLDAGLVGGSTIDAITRRAFGRKAALGTAAAASLALVSTMAAPTPAMASSGGPTTTIAGPLVCGINEVEVDGACVCKDGYVRFNGLCIRASACPDTHEIVDGVCVPRNEM